MRFQIRILVAIAATVLLVTGIAHAQPADTIRAGNPTFKGALPHFGTDTVEGYKVENGEWIPGSTQIRTIKRVSENGEDLILVTVKHISSDASDTTVNQTALRTSDLSLMRQSVRAPQDSGVVTYALGVISGWVVPPGGDWHTVNVHVGHPVFPDDGLSPWMLGMLPLKPDYEAAVPFFNMWRGEEVVQTLRVVGEGELAEDDRKVDCWKVRVDGQGPPGFEQTRWISKDSRRLIKQAYLKGKGDPEYWGVTRNWY